MLGQGKIISTRESKGKMAEDVLDGRMGKLTSFEYKHIDWLSKIAKL